MASAKFLVLLLICIFGPGLAEASVLDKLEAGASSKVVEVVDGDTVILDPPIDGAEQVRLVGLQAPKLSLGRSGFKEWPLAPDAKYALETLTLGKRVALAFGGARMDRHGRHLAHLFLDDGTWVQGDLLQRGMARVYTFSDNRALADEMYALEAAARAARRGIWAHPFYEVRSATPEALGRPTGTFQVIEGTALDVAKVNRRVYINFGDNWRTDFTITLERKAQRMFTKKGIDLLSYEGKRLRVRGWLKKRNGPAINVSHPEQIEVLD